jgi:hypothetical protein
MELRCYLRLLVGRNGYKQKVVYELNAHPPVCGQGKVDFG